VKPSCRLLCLLLDDFLSRDDAALPLRHMLLSRGEAESAGLSHSGCSVALSQEMTPLCHLLCRPLCRFVSRDDAALPAFLSDALSPSLEGRDVALSVALLLLLINLRHSVGCFVVFSQQMTPSYRLLCWLLCRLVAFYEESVAFVVYSFGNFVAYRLLCRVFCRFLSRNLVPYAGA
jgi:hypothetical protein